MWCESTAFLARGLPTNTLERPAVFLWSAPMKERKGRMINKDISNSKGFASLSPAAAVLFAMIIPHYNSFGKMNGGPGYIKDEVCPFVEYLNSKTIPGLLSEISEKTNVKWFIQDGRHWIHSINFLTEHQDLRPDRMGKDLLPDYDGTSQGQVLPEVKRSKVKTRGEINENDPYLKAIEYFWKEYPHRNGTKRGKIPTESNIRKYIKSEELSLLQESVLNYKKSEDVKNKIGIADPERFIYSAKKKCEPWRDWIGQKKELVV